MFNYSSYFLGQVSEQFYMEKVYFRLLKTSGQSCWVLCLLESLRHVLEGKREDTELTTLILFEEQQVPVPISSWKQTQDFRRRCARAPPQTLMTGLARSTFCIFVAL